MKIEASNPNALISNVANLQKTQQATLPNSPTETSNRTSSAPAIGGTHSGDKVSIQVEVSRKTLETLQQFGQVGDFLNTMATNLRQTQEALKASSEVIDKMKGKLDTIVKNYPPYSIADKARMALLMGYSGLQKEIRSLMVPKPPPPVYEKVQSMWDNLFTSLDGTVPAPQLPTDAPDSQVKLAATQLDSLSDQVVHVREALSNSVKAM